MYAADTPGGHDLFTVWAKFDKTDLYTYDVSITYKEASKMQDLQNWISRYLVDCKYQKGLEGQSNRLEAIFPCSLLEIVWSYRERD